MPSLEAERVVDGLGNAWGEETGHIVAARDGIVAELTVKSGTAMVRPGDVVKKGDILIGGVIDVVGDDGGVVAKHAVLAAGIPGMTERELCWKFLGEKYFHIILVILIRIVI